MVRRRSPQVESRRPPTLCRPTALAVALLVLVAGGACEPSETDAPVRAAAPTHLPPSCRGVASWSRWLPAEGVYRITASFLEEDGLDLGGASGLARAPDARVFVLDLWFPRIVVLDANLRPLESFGRAGEGPGELARWRARNANTLWFDWLALADDLLLVFDGRRVTRFTSAGDPLSTSRSLPGTLALAPKMIGAHLVGAEAQLAVWVSDATTPFARRLFRAEALKPDRVHVGAMAPSGAALEVRSEFPMPALPTFPNRGVVTRPDQARPLVAWRGRCLVFANGSDPDIHLTDTFGGAEPIILPIPDGLREYGPSDASGMAEWLGIEPDEVPEPTAVVRWQRLRVDPDGWIWIAPRGETPSANIWDEPIEALVVNPATGRVLRTEVPEFPDEFGSPGVFYALYGHAPTGLTGIRKYEIDPDAR